MLKISFIGIRTHIIWSGCALLCSLVTWQMLKHVLQLNFVLFLFVFFLETSFCWCSTNIPIMLGCPLVSSATNVVIFFFMFFI